jgi:hypothetical protein
VKAELIEKKDFPGRLLTKKNRSMGLYEDEEGRIYFSHLLGVTLMSDDISTTSQEELEQLPPLRHLNFGEKVLLTQ